MTDPFALLPSGLPDYPSLRPEQLQPVFEQLCDANASSLAQIVAEQGLTPDWAGLVLAIERLDQRVQDVFHTLVPLAYESEPWALAIDACHQRLMEWEQHKLGYPGLYDAYALLDTPALSKEQRLVLSPILKAFRLAGHRLAELERKQLRATEAAIGSLEQQFLGNLNTARDSWTLLLDDEQRLRGLPDAARTRLAARAEDEGQHGWLVDLGESTVEVILAWADDRELRETVYRASHSLASALGADPQHDNAPVLQALLRLRQERAQLLGAANAAEFGLENKDAATTEQVMAFIEALIELNRPRLQADLQQLQLKADELGLATLAPWDVAYLSRLLRPERLVDMDARLRSGLALDRVLPGLYSLYERLFGITLAPVAINAWNADVQVLQVSEQGEPLGHVFLDAQAREGKLPWPYSYPLRSRHVEGDGQVTLPMALISCSFDQAPGLSHLDLCKLFHEFGHALHQILVSNAHRRLNRTDLLALGPDHSEFVGTLFEQWCWSASTLHGLYTSGEGEELLSVEDIEHWLADKRRLQAVSEAEKLCLGWFDFVAHRDGNARQDLRGLAIAATDHVGLPEVFGENRFAESFDYLVTGYEAGYYCYKWAQVHAVDAFARFTEAGAQERSLGLEMRSELLAVGASATLGESFERFVGRPVSFDAYAVQQGSA